MADFKPPTSTFWDQKYHEDSFVYGEAPDDYLAAQKHRFRPGMSALVPGDGEGRNGVWLAEQGLEVTAVDLSEAGIRKARGLAAQRGVSITAIQADLMQWEWPVARFDVVVAIFLHLPPSARRVIHRAMFKALRSGGFLVIQGFRPEQLRYRQEYGASGGPPAEEMLFSEMMLRDDFAEAKVMELESVDVNMGESGAHSGLCAVVRGLFQRDDGTA